MALSYDGLNRLATASGFWGSGAVVYRPSSDDILTKTIGSQSLAYNTSASTNRLDSVSGSEAYSFQYDDYGNVANNGRNTFVYDEASLLRSIGGGGANTLYAFDANNRRVLEVKGSSLSRYTGYSLAGSRLFEDDTVSGLSTDFIYLNGTLVASDTECSMPSQDTDGDGIPNCVESTAGLDPLDAQDGTLDSDADGLTNLEEYQAGTNYFSADTDNDGLSDGYEVQYALNAILNDSSVDSDSDGLTNLEEYALGTNPSNDDTDGDGLIDSVDPNPTFNPAVMTVIVNYLLS